MERVIRGYGLFSGFQNIPVQAPPQKQELTLHPHQLVHVESISEILKKRKGYIDVSSMGTGKTYALAAIALKFNIRFLVLCLKPAPWDKLQKDINLRDLYMGYITLGKLTSGKEESSRGYLKRFEVPKKVIKGGIEVIEYDIYFVATQKWADECTRGIMLVVDEAQSVKNKGSQRTDAVKCMFNTLNSVDGPSRYALLSATLFDKIEHAKSFVMTTGFVTSNEMLVPLTGGGNEPTGLAELVANCYAIDPATTNSIIGRYGTPNGLNINAIVYDLYISVIHINMAVEMPDPLPFRKFRGFFKMSRREDIQEFDRLVEQLRDETGYDETTNTFRNQVDLAQLKTVMMKTELTLVHDMCRVQNEWLVNNPGGKVVFFVMYKEQIIDKIKDTMTELGHRCITITGDTRPSERLGKRQQFLNGETFNVLVTTLQTSAEAISLKDEYGNHPINTLCTPNFYAILTHQASSRSNRLEQLSLPYFYLFYPAQRLAGILMRILEKQGEKGGIIMSTRMRNSSKVSEMPGGYPRFIEECGFVDEDRLLQMNNGVEVSTADLLLSCSVGAPENRNLGDIPFYDPMDRVPTLLKISGIIDDNDNRENPTSTVKLVQHIGKLFSISNIEAQNKMLEIELYNRNLKLVLGKNYVQRGMVPAPTFNFGAPQQSASLPSPQQGGFSLPTFGAQQATIPQQGGFSLPTFNLGPQQATIPQQEGFSLPTFNLGPQQATIPQQGGFSLPTFGVQQATIPQQGGFNLPTFGVQRATTPQQGGFSLPTFGVQQQSASLPSPQVTTIGFPPSTFNLGPQQVQATTPSPQELRFDLSGFNLGPQQVQATTPSPQQLSLDISRLNLGASTL